MIRVTRKSAVFSRWTFDNAILRGQTSTHLGYVVFKDLREVFGLGDDEEVKSPGAAKVGDDDRPDRH